MALDLGAMTVFLYTFTEREKLAQTLFELLTGARFTTYYTRVGGQIRDLPGIFHRSSSVHGRFHSAAGWIDVICCTRNLYLLSIARAIRGVITKDRCESSP